MEDTQSAVTQKSGMNPLIVSGLVVVALLLGAGMLLMGNKSKNQTPEVSDVMTKESLTNSARPGADAMDTADTTITVEGGSFYYKPNQITVKKGTKVKIIMTSKDMMHDIVIDELNVKSTIAKSGESTTVEFTPDKVGTFEYYCSVGQHRKNGMFGTLVVEE